MFCPKCRTEYRDGFSVCADCHVNLVETIPPEPEPEWLDLTEVSIIDNPAEMAFISSILEEQNIAYIFKSVSFMNTGMYADPAKLLVRPDQADAARRILAETKQSLEEEKIGDSDFFYIQQSGDLDDPGIFDYPPDDIDSEEEGVYNEKWENYSQLKGWAVMVMAAGLPLAVAITFITALFSKDIRIFSVCLLVAWCLPLNIVLQKYRNWPCPRCGNAFHQKGAIRNNFSSECLHCGLPKWECHDIGYRKDIQTDELACLKCGNLICEDESTCPHCGWSWEAG